MSRRSRNRKERRGGAAKRFRLAVMISGSGTGLQNLIDRIADGRMPGCEIVVVVSSRAEAAGAARAAAAGLPVDVIRVKDHPDVARFSDMITLTLDAFMPDLVVQSGWLCYWRLPPRWLGKVINLHPALLPAFGGKGMHGMHVHEAVLAAGARESGATVHWVDNEYDHGAIIDQARCGVESGDTPESLAARVQALERELLPRVILRIAAARR